MVKGDIVRAGEVTCLTARFSRRGPNVGERQCIKTASAGLRSFEWDVDGKADVAHAGPGAE
jgi:hypothetical protein